MSKKNTTGCSHYHPLPSKCRDVQLTNKRYFLFRGVLLEWRPGVDQEPIAIGRADEIRMEKAAGRENLSVECEYFTVDNPATETEQQAVADFLDYFKTEHKP